jgi:DNA-binding CsgD family transcriptional regulator
MLAYGSGFLMAAYFPFYFYKSFDLAALKFHACYGAPLFLLLPYFVFFVLTYRVLGDLEFAIDYGLIVPCFYSPILLFSMFRAIRIRQPNHSIPEKQYRGLEIHMVYWAVSPWVFMCLFAYVAVPQWIEVVFTNFGFIINGLLFLHRSGRYERLERLRLMEKDAIEARRQMHLIKNCMDIGLSSRETEIALMLCLGKTYKGIGDQLFISRKTVDAHVQHIFSKTGVNRKMELQKVLGCGGIVIQNF